MIRIYPSILKGTVKAPASKAHAQRLLFASSIPTTPTVIHNVELCDDIKTSFEALRRFGCNITDLGGGSFSVEPFAKTVPVPSLDLDFKDSATTARFAIALAAAYGIKLSCSGSASLLKRQMGSLTTLMAVRGISFDSFSLPLHMSGRLEGGEYSFRGDEGSQFISAVMLALPMALSDSHISFSTEPVDRAFIDITADVLRDFGITIEDTEDGGFFIPGKQLYTSPSEAWVENDWGLASAWICAAAINQSKGSSITVTDLPKNSHQRYRAIKTALSLAAQDFKDITMDMSCGPDLTTIIAAAAFFKGATVTLSGVPQLKSKETNRLAAMAEVINSLGGSAKASEDGITVSGPENGEYKEDTVIDCKGDPWIFMAFALCSGLMDKPIIIKDESCASKIYESFLDDYKNLGGKYEIIE